MRSYSRMNTLIVPINFDKLQFPDGNEVLLKTLLEERIEELRNGCSSLTGIRSYSREHGYHGNYRGRNREVAVP